MAGVGQSWSNWAPSCVSRCVKVGRVRSQVGRNWPRCITRSAKMLDLVFNTGEPPPCKTKAKPEPPQTQPSEAGNYKRDRRPKPNVPHTWTTEAAAEASGAEAQRETRGKRRRAAPDGCARGDAARPQLNGDAVLGSRHRPKLDVIGPDYWSRSAISCPHRSNVSNRGQHRPSSV